jgi:hypothetical protein
MKQCLSTRVLADNLKVMDASAVALCRDNNIPIVVFSIRERAILPRCCAAKDSHRSSPPKNEGAKLNHGRNMTRPISSAA